MTKEGGQSRGPLPATKKSMKTTPGHAGRKLVTPDSREDKEHRNSNSRQNQLESRSEPFGFDDDENINSSPSSINADDGLMMPKGRKRSYVAPDEEQAQDFGSEMQKMLECFGADITRTLVAKRKRLEQFTQNSLKTSSKKVEDIWKGQQLERGKLNEEFQRQMMNVFQQWDADIDKSKEQEEKLLNLFKQQQKVFQQGRVVQSQRLKTVRQLHEQYSKGIDDLEKCHQEQQSSVQAELKKEMALLQKKILMDTQQQEMANVKKSLQTMLF